MIYPCYAPCRQGIQVKMHHWSPLYRYPTQTPVLKDTMVKMRTIANEIQPNVYSDLPA